MKQQAFTKTLQAFNSNLNGTNSTLNGNFTFNYNELSNFSDNAFNELIKLAMLVLNSTLANQSATGVNQPVRTAASAQLSLSVIFAILSIVSTLCLLFIRDRIDREGAVFGKNLELFNRLASIKKEIKYKETVFYELLSLVELPNILEKEAASTQNSNLLIEISKSEKVEKDQEIEPHEIENTDSINNLLKNYEFLLLAIQEEEDKNPNIYQEIESLVKRTKENILNLNQKNNNSKLEIGEKSDNHEKFAHDFLKAFSTLKKDFINKSNNLKDLSKTAMDKLIEEAVNLKDLLEKFNDVLAATHSKSKIPFLNMFLKTINEFNLKLDNNISAKSLLTSFTLFAQNIENDRKTAKEIIKEKDKETQQLKKEKEKFEKKNSLLLNKNKELKKQIESQKSLKK